MALRRPVLAVLNPIRTEILQVLAQRSRTLKEIRFMLGADHDCLKRIAICDAIRFLSKRNLIKLNREYKFELTSSISFLP